MTGFKPITQCGRLGALDSGAAQDSAPFNGQTSRIRRDRRADRPASNGRPLDAVHGVALGRPERSKSRDDDFQGKDIGIAKIVEFFEAFIFEPEDVETRFVAVRSFIHLLKPNPNTPSYSESSTRLAVVIIEVRTQASLSAQQQNQPHSLPARVHGNFSCFCVSHWISFR